MFLNTRLTFLDIATDRRGYITDLNANYQNAPSLITAELEILHLGNIIGTPLSTPQRADEGSLYFHCKIDPAVFPVRQNDRVALRLVEATEANYRIHHIRPTLRTGFWYKVWVWQNEETWLNVPQWRYSTLRSNLPQAHIDHIAKTIRERK